MLDSVRLPTERLTLEPVTADLARAVVSGDLSALNPVRGWPHDDTLDALSLAVQDNAGPIWLIKLDGLVIGDCGTHGQPDPSGVVEIGYGLARSQRGHGYATEAARAICEWLFTRDDVTAIRASGVLTDNTASRSVLEKLGFTMTSATTREVTYTKSRP